MTRDDIIRLAQEACSPDAPFRQYVNGVDCGMLMRDEHLERFAALVAAAEREACALMAQAFGRNGYDFTGDLELHEAIRARGK